MPGGRAAFRPRVPTALLAGSGHWHVAGIISAQPWPAGSFPGPARRPGSFIAAGPPALATGRVGVRPYRGQGLGGQTHRDAHSAGAVGTGTAGDGNGLAQARLRLAARRAPGPPNRHRQARIRLGWVLALGCRRVSPHHPAIYRVTSAAGASPACASSPALGCESCGWCRGAGGTRGALERHGGGHAGVRGLCLERVGVFQEAQRG